MKPVETLKTVAEVGRHTALRLLLERYGAAPVKAAVHDFRAFLEPPLLRATEGGHTEIVRILVLECGADVEEIHRGGQALNRAVELGRDSVIRVLIGECGANVNASNSLGYSPLH